MNFHKGNNNAAHSKRHGAQGELFYVKISLETGSFLTKAVLLGSSSLGRDRRGEKLHAGGGYREGFSEQVQQEPGCPPWIPCPEGEMKTDGGEPGVCSRGDTVWRAETGSSSDQKEMCPSFRVGENEVEYAVDNIWPLRL